MPDYEVSPQTQTARVHEWKVKSSDGASNLTYFQDLASGVWVLAKIGVHNERRKRGVGTEMVELVFHLAPTVSHWRLPLTSPDGYAFANALEARYTGAITFTRNGMFAG